MTALRIGILEAGRLSPQMEASHGSFPQIFETALSAHLPAARFDYWAPMDGEIPSPSDADGWLVTGSKHGVRDELPWMTGLMTFLRECLRTEVPVVGVCFGHQILAEAMGGHVDKAPQGWGLGVSRYETQSLPAWLEDELGRGYASHAVHQDQVQRLPPGSLLLASSDHCPIAALAYGDPDAPSAISVQSHPEFEPEFVADLLVDRLDAGVLTPELVRAAVQGRPVDNHAWHRVWARVLSGSPIA